MMSLTIRCFLVWVTLLSGPLLFSQRAEVVVSTGHTSIINSVDISPDGKWIATGSSDKTIKIIDAATGKEFRTLSVTGNMMYVKSVKFSPNSQLLGAYIEGKSIKVFDVSTGELKNEFPCFFPDFDFCLDNDHLVFIGNHWGRANIVQISTGKLITQSRATHLHRLVIDPVFKKYIYAYDKDANIVQIDCVSGSTLEKKSILSEYRYVTCAMSIDPDNKWLAISTSKNDQVELLIHSIKDLKRKGSFKVEEDGLIDLAFHNNKPLLAATGSGNDNFIWDISKMREKLEHRQTKFPSCALAVHPADDIFLVCEWTKVHYVDFSNGKILKTFIPSGNRIVNMVHDQKGSFIAAACRNSQVKIWDLKQNKIIKTIQAFHPIAFSTDGKTLISNGVDDYLTITDVITGKQTAYFETENVRMRRICLNKSSTLLAGSGGVKGTLFIWDMRSKKRIQKLNGHRNEIYALDFSIEGNYLASGGRDSTIRIWNLQDSADPILIKTNSFVGDVKFSPDGKYLASSSWNDKKVSVWNTTDWSLKHSLAGHVNGILALDFSADSKFLASGGGNNALDLADNSVIVWDVEKGTQLCQFKGHRGAVKEVVFDQHSSMIYSAGDDGMILCWDYKTCKEKMRMISSGKDGFVVVAPDNYYMASRDALKDVSFRIGTTLYPFEQFDLKLNRPDIICSRMGKTPKGLVNAYEYLYKKRLRKMGFTEQMLGDDFHMPTLNVLSSTIPLSTTDKNLQFDVQAKDELFQLERINVYVNDVPIYGLDGITLKQYDAKSIKHQIDLELTPGVNEVQVSVINVKGVESLRETFSIIYNATKEKGDLYLITIGVSEYQDHRFNLKYPAKDARDVSSTMAKSAEMYANVKIKSINNQEASKESILGLASFLASAKSNDVVIIFVAGHGILDESFNYYFGTYDTDFDHPSDRGISYQVLEELLANTKAYRKLLIMDTCHSGELDKQEVEEVESEDVEIGDIIFRNVSGTGIRRKEGFGVDNTSELMESLFSDVRKRTGATIISSAAGIELAMEGDDWKNGLFTYCFLQGLTTGDADKNRDGEIYISEIQQYVYSKVKELSNGKQKPTARSENLSLDYRIW